MAFPSSPINGQQYTIGNSTWKWVSAQSLWNLVDATKLPATTTHVFTSSGTWTIPINASMAHITLIGAGGGGRTGSSITGSNGIGGDGGGGGGLTSSLIDLKILLANATTFVTITVGVGGVQNTAGGDTTFDFLKAGGGNAGGGYGQFQGGSGGSGGMVSSTGSNTIGSGGLASFGAAGGGSGGSASNASYSVIGGSGGGSPVYTMATGDIYGVGIENMPVPGINDNTGTAKFGAGGNGGNYSSGTLTSGTTGGNGLVVIKTWYNS